MTERLLLWEVEVPFRRPLVTASGTFSVRHSVIVAMETDKATGWAEAPGFPSGRFGTTTAAFTDLSAPDGWVDGLPTVPIAAAALHAARNDAAARSALVPLHEYLGADGRPVAARHPIGIGDLEQAASEAAWIEAHGIIAIKLKIRPGHDVQIVAAIRHSLPDLDIGVDANGAYTEPDDPALAALDDLGVSFIEQPFAPPDWKAHAALRERTRMAVCLDESVPNTVAARHAVSTGSADWLAVKLNRVGLPALRETVAIANEAGVGIQLGGTFDTSIGRRHLLAAASLPGVVDAAVGPPSGYLSEYVADYPELKHGMVAPSPQPGIGTEPEPDLFDRAALRRSTIEL